MTMRRLIVIVPLLFVLTGCTPPASSPSAAPPAPDAGATTSIATQTPAPHSESPYAPDVMFVVTATATADNGAVMDLILQVHRSQAWNTPGTTQASTMTEACGGGMDSALYDSGLFSFTTVDVDTVLRDGPDWPADRRIFVLPYSTYVLLASTGFPANDDEVDPATPHCRTDKVIDGQGSGQLVVGLKGDTDAAGAAGNFTRWANHNYGFVSVRVAGQSAASAGISLSDCASVVTDLGAQFHGGADWWSSQPNDTHCVFGSAQEDADF